MSGYCFYIYPPPLGVSDHGHSSWTTDWIIQNRPHLHQIYILNLGLTAGELQALQLILLLALGAVDEPLDSPLSVFGFQKWQLVCTFGTVERIIFMILLLSISCLSVILHSPRVAFYFFPFYILLWNNFLLYKVLCTTIFHRHSLDSFLLEEL